MIQRKIPNELVNIYLTFLKGKDRVIWAVENYYGNPTPILRSKLLQEICKILKGKYSVRVIKASTIIEFLDQFNTITERPKNNSDVDFDEATLLSILNKGAVRNGRKVRTITKQNERQDRSTTGACGKD